jgi:hypothetical protein
VWLVFIFFLFLFLSFPFWGLELFLSFNFFPSFLSFSFPFLLPLPTLISPTTDDHRILPNDWPYGLAPGIVHLVVWTKFALPTDPTTNELEPATQRLVQDFVDRTFVRVCGADRVVWFLNGPELKSVLAVEHFHVLLLEPDVEWVTGLVGGVVAVGVVEAEADEAEGRDGDGDAPIGYT